VENNQIDYDAQIAACDDEILKLQKEIERLKNEKTKAQMQLEGINREIERNKEAFRQDFPDVDVSKMFAKEGLDA
jgi:hypothetical protein